MLRLRQHAMSLAGTRLPIRDIRGYGESWRMSGLATGAGIRHSLRAAIIVQTPLYAGRFEAWPQRAPQRCVSSRIRLDFPADDLCHAWKPAAHDRAARPGGRPSENLQGKHAMSELRQPLIFETGRSRALPG
jgi:hypothetical protein